jgi:uncharacterized protein YvpB
MTNYQRAVLLGLLFANLGLAAILAIAWLAGAGPLGVAVAEQPLAASPAPTPAPGAGLLPGPASGRLQAPARAAWPTPVPPPTRAPARSTAAAAAVDAPPPVPSAGLPESAHVIGLAGHRQTLPLSCESRSAVDWAAFFGFTLDEIEFHAGLPKTDDPDRGFVGDVNGAWGQVPPASYGVHAGPVAQRLRALGVPAVAERYWTWDELRGEIAAGRPVLVWVTGHVEPGEGVIYQAADGRKTIVAPFEHTVIVTGYTADSVTIVDGARVYTRPLATFLASWQALRNLAVVAGFF